MEQQQIESAMEQAERRETTTTTTTTTLSAAPRVLIPMSESNTVEIGHGVVVMSGDEEAAATAAPVTPKSNSESSATEKVGRWSEEEHLIFLDGLQKHGKQWKTIATMIGTRTVVQVRTHAQKYFQKVERQNKPNVSNNSSTSTSTSTSGTANNNNNKNSTMTVVQTEQGGATSTTSTATQGAVKRKSITSAAPSRKKVKSVSSNNNNNNKNATNNDNSNTTVVATTNKTKQPQRSASLEAIPVSTSPTPELSADYPNYISSTSSASDTWSIVSPSGVMDVVDLVSFEAPPPAVAATSPSPVPPAAPDSGHESGSDEQFQDHNNQDDPTDHPSSSSSGDSFFDLNELDEDPLKWLVDSDAVSGIVHQYLPESSLPFFPDLSSGTTSTTLEEQQLQPFDGMLMDVKLVPDPTREAAKSVMAEAPPSVVDDLVMGTLVDPTVTVQSLFLVDE